MKVELEKSLNEIKTEIRDQKKVSGQLGDFIDSLLGEVPQDVDKARFIMCLEDNDTTLKNLNKYLNLVAKKELDKFTIGDICGVVAGKKLIFKYNNNEFYLAINPYLAEQANALIKRG